MESNRGHNFFVPPDDDLSVSLSYAFYVNYKPEFPHHKESNGEETPYLWTKDAGYCLPIAFINKKEGTIYKIGLYHSVSEHLLDMPESKNFETFVKSFLNDVDDPENLEIITSFNPLAHTKGIKSDAKSIKKFINHYCFKKFNKNVPEHNFHEYEGAETFFITLDGRYGNLFETGKIALESIKELIRTFLVDHLLYLNNELQPILTGIYHSKNPFETLAKIKKVVGNLLLKGLTEENSKINDDAIELFKQIIAWDLILNDVSQKLCDIWFFENGLFVDEELGKSSESNSSSDDDQEGDEEDTDMDNNKINDEEGSKNQFQGKQ